jgi:hypothetical protein
MSADHHLGRALTIFKPQIEGALVAALGSRSTRRQFPNLLTNVLNLARGYGKAVFDLADSYPRLFQGDYSKKLPTRRSLLRRPVAAMHRTTILASLGETLGPVYTDAGLMLYMNAPAEYSNEHWVKADQQAAQYFDALTSPHRQEFMAWFDWRTPDRIDSFTIKTGRIGAPFWSLGLAPLIEAGVVPADRQRQDGYGYLQPEDLEPVLRTTYRLPDQMQWERRVNEFEYWGADLRYIELVGTGRFRDGREVSVRGDTGSNTIATVNFNDR